VGQATVEVRPLLVIVLLGAVIEIDGGNYKAKREGSE